MRCANAITCYKIVMLKRIMAYTEKFTAKETSSGIFTIFAALTALIVANSPASDFYEKIAKLTHHAVNDWLMIIFFLVIALELKREMNGGMLSNVRQVLLPLVAAIGGMIVPAIIYMYFNTNSGALHGWAIPTATDIAFALSVLLIAGKYAPPSLKIFLLAIAIFDDLGAILIIAIFYSDSLEVLPLGFSILTIAGMYLMNRTRVMNIKFYLIMGLILAALLHWTGIHTTIAGVITGLMIPQERNQKLFDSLHYYSAFIIVPIFAFVNAGVSLEGLSLTQLTRPVTIGVLLGLFVGKQLGVFGFTYIAVKTKLAKLPQGANWRDIYAISVIAGIGFTMSLFISALAFTSVFTQEKAKIGILIGSLLSAVLGAVLLRFRKKLPN